MLLSFLALIGSAYAAGGTCRTLENTDTVEMYYSKKETSTAADCCSLCSADIKCNFAAFDTANSQCYLKDAKTLTKRNASGVILQIKNQEPPNPHPKPPHSQPSPPPPPLPPPKYKVVLAEHNALPALSSANAKGKGASPCPKTFNPSYVEVAGENKVGGIIVRTDGCNATQGRMSFAKCDVQTGICDDLNASYQIPPSQGTQDPRVIYNKYDQYFYNFAYGGNSAQSKADGCPSSGLPGAPGACTVVLSRTKTPADSESWEHVPGGTYPWHRNGCCWMQPTGQRTYCIFGESGSEGPGSGLGIAYTTDISKGKFTQTNWTGGVPGVGGHGLWMKALGAAQQEIKLEAGAHMVQLESGDLLHFYAAATPGWVNNGNYTAGYIILDKDEPTKIIQRGSGQFLIPTYPFETLCNHKNVPDPGTCKYTGERRNVIFMCSATKIGPNKFRLFFGGGDGNVGTGVVQVFDL